jgi:hypothetical protein
MGSRASNRDPFAPPTWPNTSGVPACETQTKPPVQLRKPAKHPQNHRIDPSFALFKGASSPVAPSYGYRKSSSELDGRYSEQNEAWAGCRFGLALNAGASKDVVENIGE